ncbi:hypothetical protein K491DRAFT_127082 [Lophiostoma macrostomum CBS 122681]|uniref:Uncharacterized protein n=1 Tax=Lophiostoma macrostomum CBS 122681 TaxID=1314788 RepID=A0A6A6SRX8_9PLEO|nr:hypothetical protein K491DRAFT_127082 [Lophiostoma macrostomum CBS 122681]
MCNGNRSCLRCACSRRDRQPPARRASRNVIVPRQPPSVVRNNIGRTCMIAFRASMPGRGWPGRACLRLRFLTASPRHEPWRPRDTLVFSHASMQALAVEALHRMESSRERHLMVPSVGAGARAVSGYLAARGTAIGKLSLCPHQAAERSTL